MKNKEIILKELDAVIAALRAKSNDSEQSHFDIQAFETIRYQYQREDINGARHTYNFVMDTYLREMLPEECGETLEFIRRK